MAMLDRDWWRRIFRRKPRTEGTDEAGQDSTALVPVRVEALAPAQRTDDQKAAAADVSGESRALPTPASTFQQVVESLTDGVATVNPIVPFQWTDLLSALSITMPDLRQAVGNVLYLGNTGHSVEVTAEKDADAEAAAERLDDLARRIWPGGAGADGAVGILLAQVVRGGALSVEFVPDDRLLGIDRVTVVPVTTIRFAGDPKRPGRYVPYQLQNSDKIGPKLAQLNQRTYLYSPLETVDGSPYAVPPMLAALWPTYMQREMLQNLGWLVKKFGLIGFVECMVKRPQRRPNETDSAYTARVRAYIREAAENYKETYRSGMVVGFEGEHQFKVNPVSAAAQGANEIWQLNEEQVFSGVNSDPAMHGRRYSTTEAFASVIYHKQISQIDAIRRLVKRALEYGYALDLALGGYRFDRVRVTFNPMPALDATKDQTVRKLEIANVIRLRDEGIITQDEAARELGYDDPAEEEPPRPYGGAGGGLAGPVPVALGRRASVVLVSGGVGGGYNVLRRSGVRNRTGAREYEERSGDELHEASRVRATAPRRAHRCRCGAGGRHVQLADDFGQEEFERRVREFLEELYGPHHEAVDEGVEAAVQFVLRAPAGITDDDLVRGLTEALARRVEDVLAGMGDLPDVAGRHTSEAYKHWRLDDPKFTPPNIRPKLDMADERAQEFLRGWSNVYLGKYVDNDDFRGPVMGLVRDRWLEKGIPPRDDIAALRAALGDRARGLSDWQLRRIAETTLNTTRNWANVHSLNQAGAVTFEIAGPLDSITCPVCKEMVGRKFTVAAAMEKIGHLQEVDPESWPAEAPFLTSRFRWDNNASAVVDRGTGRPMRDVKDDELQAMGYDTPPYHPHCRHRLVADSFGEE